LGDVGSNSLDSAFGELWFSPTVNERSGAPDGEGPFLREDLDHGEINFGPAACSPVAATRCLPSLQGTFSIVGFTVFLFSWSKLSRKHRFSPVTSGIVRQRPTSKKDDRAN
jgi:hypothetical protein